MNKKDKKKWAILGIIAVVAFFVHENNSRAGLDDTQLNSWYGDNYTAVIIIGLVLIVAFIMWGFHEGKITQQIQLAKETRKTYESYGRIGGQK
jgi:hypothetical protein